ncbi:hypothetical protein [Roseibium sp.]|uniref:hypothetical protein n=1 Tax=Roseibium sp. TaxID=1936156 RepID=UPI003B52E733
MFELHRSNWFADIRLLVDIKKPVSGVRDSESCFPELPDGMRIDHCVLDALTFTADEGACFKISMKIEPKPNLNSNWEAGQALDAMVFDDAAGNTACIGMRDPDWMETEFPIRVLRASTRDALHLAAFYEVFASTKVTVEFATAWTINASNEQEALSPWFAVDRTLSF